MTERGARVVSFLYRLSSFRVILSLPKDLECEAFISCTWTVEGVDPYRGLGGAVSFVGEGLAPPLLRFIGL